jgi:serine/threonine protein kinase
MARHSLPSGYKLHWYVVRDVLGQGGFGITYLADDTNLNQRVAIKEYLPTELAFREDDDSVHPVSGEHGDQYAWGLDRFIKEARTLARFKHPNIVRVLTVFTDNNTAYMVMEYEQGRALHDVLKERGMLPEAEQRQLIMPLLDGLEQVHAMGFIHRDIKPANIYQREDGTPVLLDFGSARQALGQQTRTLTTMVSPGFAPFEQYVSKSDKQGPWTDIYGLGATLYRATVGRSPPNAVDRSEALLHAGKDILVPAVEIMPAGFSKAFLHAVDHALCFRADDRPQDIAAWRSEFTGVSADSEAATLPLYPNGDAATEATPAAAVNAGETFQFESTGNVSTGADEPASAPAPAPATPHVAPVTHRKLKWGISLLAVLLLAVLVHNARQDPQKPVTPQPQQQAEAGSDRSTPTVLPDSTSATTVSSPDGEESTDTQSAADTENRIARLLRVAGQDIEALRLTSPEGNNAVEKYQQVLGLEPENREAATGLYTVAGKYIELMDAALMREDWIQARNYLGKAVDVEPSHSGLDDARQRMRAAVAAASRQNRPEPAQAESTQSQGDLPSVVEQDRTSLMTEQERSMLLQIREMLSRNPDDQDARNLARRMARNFERNLKQALEAGEFELAENYVREALEISPDNEGLQKALRKIREARKNSGK